MGKQIILDDIRKTEKPRIRNKNTRRNKTERKKDTQKTFERIKINRKDQENK